MRIITLVDGTKLPLIGFGTLGLTGQKGIDSIVTAIKSGYRHIDTAQVYNTEYEVGRAVEICINEGIVKREDLFITSKIDPHKKIGYNEAITAVKNSIEIMFPNGGYIDMYMIHYPNAAPGAEWKKLNEQTWKGLEKCFEDGFIKHLGISNFMTHHIEELLKTALIKPVVNQIHLCPIWQQKDLVNFCEENNILCSAWAPRVRPFDIVDQVLGRKVYPEVEDWTKPIFEELTQKYGKDSTQITLKWCLQKGFIPIVKSANTVRQKSNLEVFDFELTDEDIHKLDSLNARPVFPDVAPDIAYTVWAYQEKLQEKEILVEEKSKIFFIPFLKYKYYNEEKQKWYLFNCLQILKIKRTKNIAKIYLFGFIPFLKTKLNGNRTKYYLLSVIPFYSKKKVCKTFFDGIRLVPDYLE